MIKIGTKRIGLNQKPFIIAEMSGNHNQSLAQALEIVKAASLAGADAIKLQTYTADSITLNVNKNEFLIKDKNSLWYGKNLYELYQEAHTPWEWHKPIMEKAKELGIICFSSPFNEKAVDFLNDLDCPVFKIASFENSHLPLLRKVGSTGKPVLISIGMASISEIGEAVEVLKESGCKDLILLKCTSTYPASPIDSNVLTIPHMRQLFGCQVGLSDHTMGIGTAISSIAHGATVIEKHFTINRSEGGVDSAFSIEPHELKQLVIESRNAWESLGKVYYGPTEKEKLSLIFRRSLYISEDMKKGESFSEKNLRIVRPGLGLAPKYINLFIGRKIKKDAEKGTPLNWDFI